MTSSANLDGDEATEALRARGSDDDAQLRSTTPMGTTAHSLASGNDGATRTEGLRAPATSEDDGACESAERKIAQAR